jgi:hypothetical protein
MMGDFPGYFILRPITIQGIQTIRVGTQPPLQGPVAVATTFQVPYVFRGGFKIADNESPRPEDRVFLGYNYYDGFGGTSTPGQTITQNILSNGRTTVTTVIPGVDAPQINVHRETIGFEKTLLDGAGSIGLRAPVIQQNGDPTIGDDNFGDLSIILKYAFYRDCHTGNLLSGGMVITTPTGPDIPLGSGSIHPALLQPFGGFIWNQEKIYVHGFSSVAVPTDSRDVTLFFNDIGVGYWLYRSPCGEGISSVVPTIEVHVTTPLNHRGQQAEIRVPDLVDLTGGVHFGLGPRSTFSVGVAVPFTGPRPFDVEALAQINCRF